MANGDIEMKLRIPAELGRKLEAARKADERTRHGMVIKILRQWLTEYGNRAVRGGK